MYEKELIDHIFEKNETVVKKSDFMTRVAGSIDEMPRCDWIFSPLKLRNIFMHKIDFEEYQEIVDPYLSQTYSLGDGGNN